MCIKFWPLRGQKYTKRNLVYIYLFFSTQPMLIIHSTYAKQKTIQVGQVFWVPSISEEVQRCGFFSGISEEVQSWNSPTNPLSFIWEFYTLQVWQIRPKQGTQKIAPHLDCGGIKHLGHPHQQCIPELSQSTTAWRPGGKHTTPGEKQSCTSWYVVFPINYRVYISQVVQDFFHQQ